jgi:predicted nucleic acid-binding protein
MKHYADSSFLVSCYLADAHTVKAKEWLLQAGAPLPFTDLHALEVPNALRLGIFRGVISENQALAAFADIASDLAAGRLVKSMVDWPVAFRLAARLSERYSVKFGSRSLDILHVASARTTRSATFLTFDARQSALAAGAGLNSLP